MSGIVNSTGARSGVIGTTVGTPAGGVPYAFIVGASVVTDISSELLIIGQGTNVLDGGGTALFTLSGTPNWRIIATAAGAGTYSMTATFYFSTVYTEGERAIGVFCRKNGSSIASVYQAVGQPQNTEDDNCFAAVALTSVITFASTDYIDFYGNSYSGGDTDYPGDSQNGAIQLLKLT